MRWVAPTEKDDANHLLEKKLWDAVGPGRRIPFGLPRTDYANYLWIQLFYSTLNEQDQTR